MTVHAAVTPTALRIGAAVALTLATLLAVLAAVRPDMMGIAMMRSLIVGFGL